MDELLARMTPGQFDEWLALEQIDPTGEQRADLRNAILICALETLFRETGFCNPDRPPWIVQDFMPFLDPEEREWAREDAEDLRQYHQQRLQIEKARLAGLTAD